MALIVENGTGGDALISLADFQAYCATVGYDLSNFDTPTEEQAIRRASMFITNNFNFKGIRVGMRPQIQAWPRYDVQTSEGWPVDYLTIPREVTYATAEAAWYELNNPDSLSPVVILVDRVLAERVGPISVDYANHGGNLAASRPILLIVRDMLATLLEGGLGDITGRANRG